MKKVLYIFCIFAVMMLQVSCDNKSNEIKSQVVEDTSNSVTSNENSLEDETIANNKSITKEEVSVNDETIQLGEIVDSGDCGESATWKLDEYGTLVISGTGELYDFAFKQDLVTFETYQECVCPWKNYDDYIKSIVIEEGITALYGGSFYAPNLVSVKLPNTLKKIEGYDTSPVFYGCTNLKNITLPNNLTILKSAFYECGLINIAFPNSLTEIGYKAFQNCTSLTDVIISNSVTTIGEYAFKSCTSLTNITISNSVTTIREYAFAYCSNLEYIYIPDSVTLMGREDTINEGNFDEVYSFIFYCCSNLQEVRLSNNITSIGIGNFYNCTKLKYLYIPDSVTKIEKAFAGCTSLETVVIPPSVTEIAEYTFAEKEQRGGYLKGKLDVTIQGAIGSCAQKYAEENDINFEVMNNPN